MAAHPMPRVDVPDKLVARAASILEENGLWGAWERDQTEEEVRAILTAVLSQHTADIIAEVRRRLVGMLERTGVGCRDHGAVGVAVLNCAGCQRQAVLNVARAVIENPRNYIGIGGARSRDLVTEQPKYPEWTVNGVIERCTDLGRLRALAIQLRAAMVGQHQVIHHHMNSGCDACQRATDLCKPSEACRLDRERQKQYVAALCATHDWS